MRLTAQFSLRYFCSFFNVALLFLLACDADDPVREDTPELITKVLLTFQSDSAEVVNVSATDPDGDGLQSMKADTVIHLVAGTRYQLHIAMLNEFASPGDTGYNVSDEVSEESEEHMIFFSWSNNVFESPSGDGNIDNRNGAVNYLDYDASGLPLGLQTEWKTATASAGSFRILLKHQPDLKSSTSQATEGETDLDAVFDLIVD